jgi:hypothetical protein
LLKGAQHWHTCWRIRWCADGRARRCGSARRGSKSWVLRPSARLQSCGRVGCGRERDAGWGGGGARRCHDGWKWRKEGWEVNGPTYLAISTE